MIFEGCATALITPFTNDEVDVDSLKKIVKYQLSNDVNALVALGTTGEPSTLNEEEKRLVVDTIVKETMGRVPVILGCGSNSTAICMQNVKQASRLGVDGVLIVTPYYNKCTQEGLVFHYTEIAKSTPLPIILYNVPSRTGVNMLPSTFEKLAHVDNIVGVKEASGNMAQIAEYIRIANMYNKAIYSGDDALTVPSMSLGAKGVISVVSNALPKRVATMTSSMRDGNLILAKDVQLSLLPLVDALFCETNPIPIKHAMSALGLCENTLRLPLTQMTKRNADKLEKLLSQFA